MPAYTTANLSFNAPITFEKQSVNLRLDMMNIGNSQYNEYEYISSGGYFAALAPDPSNPPSGYINAYPGAPRSDLRHNLLSILIVAGNDSGNGFTGRPRRQKAVAGDP